MNKNIIGIIFIVVIAIIGISTILGGSNNSSTNEANEITIKNVLGVNEISLPTSDFSKVEQTDGTAKAGNLLIKYTKTGNTIMFLENTKDSSAKSATDKLLQDFPDEITVTEKTIAGINGFYVKETNPTQGSFYFDKDGKVYNIQVHDALMDDENIKGVEAILNAWLKA